MNIWFSVAMFLAGMIVTLLGAWAVHSVTQSQLSAAINSQEKLFNANLLAVKALIEIMDRKIDQMQSQLDRRLVPRHDRNEGTE